MLLPNLIGSGGGDPSHTLIYSKIHGLLYDVFPTTSIKELVLYPSMLIMSKVVGECLHSIPLALVHLILNNVGRLVSASIQLHLWCWSI
jgi:hypothetical protein